MKYIVCINRAGLGNRLKGMISAMRLSKITGRKLLLYWENNQYLGCDFKDLFENNIEEIGEKILEQIKKDNSIVIRDVIGSGWESYDFLVIDSWKFQFLPGEIKEGFSEVYSSQKGNNVDFEFQRIPENIRKILLKELFSLRPTKDILEAVKRLEKKNNIKERIGVHIRRGDNLVTVDGREKIGTDEEFMEIIKRNKKEKFFVSTDSVGVAKKIKEKFGDKIVYYPEMDKKRAEKESIKEALIAMILLSKTKKIYGSFLSTFSEMAWWFSGCKSEIIIVGDAKKYKQISGIRRKLRFYKVNFLRWLMEVYK